MTETTKESDQVMAEVSQVHETTNTNEDLGWKITSKRRFLNWDII